MDTGKISTVEVPDVGIEIGKGADGCSVGKGGSRSSRGAVKVVDSGEKQGGNIGVGGGRRDFEMKVIDSNTNSKNETIEQQMKAKNPAAESKATEL